MRLDQADWFSRIAECLADDGIAELCCVRLRHSRAGKMPLGASPFLPIDSGAVLTYARLTAIVRDEAVLTARLELPEAWQ